MTHPSSDLAVYRLSLEQSDIAGQRLNCHIDPPMTKLIHPSSDSAVYSLIHDQVIDLSSDSDVYKPSYLAPNALLVSTYADCLSNRLEELLPDNTSLII